MRFEGAPSPVEKRVSWAPAGALGSYRHSPSSQVENHFTPLVSSAIPETPCPESQTLRLPLGNPTEPRRVQRCRIDPVDRAAFQAAGTDHFFIGAHPQDAFRVAMHRGDVVAAQPVRRCVGGEVRPVEPGDAAAFRPNPQHAGRLTHHGNQVGMRQTIRRPVVGERAFIEAGQPAAIRSRPRACRIGRGGVWLTRLRGQAVRRREVDQQASRSRYTLRPVYDGRRAQTKPSRPHRRKCSAPGSIARPSARVRR